MEIVKPKAILHTPAGETVIDMGQNMTGYVSFICREPRGTKVLLEHGRYYRTKCFYNQNYRTAKRVIYIFQMVHKGVFMQNYASSVFSISG